MVIPTRFERVTPRLGIVRLLLHGVSLSSVILVNPMGIKLVLTSAFMLYHGDASQRGDSVATR